jgi:hypothetical protein
MMLVAYAAAAMGRMDPQRLTSLICNLLGSALVLVSLSRDFNLSAVVMESAWLLAAAAGLVRLTLKRRS